METQRGPGEESATTEPQRPNVGTTVEQAAGVIPPIVSALLQEAIDAAVIVNALRTSR